MGHLSSRNYERMGRRLEQYAYGAFVSDTLLEILKELVTDEEASTVKHRINSTG